MKIIINRIGKILAIISVLVLPATAAFSEEPRIIKVVGKAEIIHLDEEQSSPAAVDVELKPGDKITVAGKGSVTIQIGKNTIYTLVKENTKVEYCGESFYQNIQRFDLKWGGIWFKIEKGNKLDLKTPHMVASVRGTEFIAQTTSKKTSVSVVSGRVLTQDLQGNQHMLETNTYAIAGPQGLIETGIGSARSIMPDKKDPVKKATTRKKNIEKDKGKKGAPGKSGATQSNTGKSSSDKGRSDKGGSGKQGNDKGAGGKSSSDKGAEGKSDKGANGKNAAGKSNNGKGKSSQAGKGKGKSGK